MSRNPPTTLGSSVDSRLRYIIKSRRQRRNRSIVDIEFANEGNFESVFPELEPGTLSRVSDVTDSLGTILREADLDYLRQAIFGDFHTIGIVAIQEHHSILRNDIE